MKAIQQVIKRSFDNHLRIAVTGLSRSGKTAFITALVNQLLNVNTGARLPLFNAAQQQRLLGVKRIPQRELSTPRFTYDQGIAALYGIPPAWPEATKGVSEISLAIRYRSNDLFSRHLKQYSTLNLEIFDYPGEWLLDLPLLEQDYFTWSKQMHELLVGKRAELAKPWLTLCQQCDPFAVADETRLAAIAQAYTDYLVRCKNEGLHFIQPGRFVLPGDLAGAPVLQFFPWQGDLTSSQLKKAAKNSYIATLIARYDYYCRKIVKGFYKQHFTGFDRQIVLVDCLQALNQGPDAFNDMRLALAQLMRSFQYGQRTLFRRLFSPCIDKLMFAATKIDHVTLDQHSNAVALLQTLIKEAWQHASFEGINMETAGLSSIQATQMGRVEYQGESILAIKGQRLSDGETLTLFPGEVPRQLPDALFWQKQGFHFENFRPLPMPMDAPLPHIRLDAVMEFLIGDKLR